jgi:hypothetical protein
MEDHHHILRTPTPHQLSPNCRGYICVCSQRCCVQPQKLVPAVLDEQAVGDVQQLGSHGL